MNKESAVVFLFLSSVATIFNLILFFGEEWYKKSIYITSGKVFYYPYLNLTKIFYLILVISTGVVMLSSLIVIIKEKTKEKKR